MTHQTDIEALIAKLLSGSPCNETWNELSSRTNSERAEAARVIESLRSQNAELRAIAIEARHVIATILGCANPGCEACADMAHLIDERVTAATAPHQEVKEQG